MRNSTLIVFLLFMLCIQAYAQTKLVKGTLTDPESGFPLPGVNVVVKGTLTGTTTDVNGYYEIEAPVGSILVFSFIISKQVMPSYLQLDKVAPQLESLSVL